MLENGRGQVRTARQVFDLPCIIRLAYMVKRPFVKRKLSKKEVLLRDRHTCQYCGLAERGAHHGPREAAGGRAGSKHGKTSLAHAYLATTGRRDGRPERRE